jgi:glycerol-3-phosphate dehydrogenase (NAD(P)+)
MTERKNSIGIIGTGAWGTALSVQFCKNQDLVLAHTLEESIANQINQHQKHVALPGIVLPKNLRATLNLKDLLNCKYLLIAVPSESIMHVLEQLAQDTKRSDLELIIATKGLDKEGVLLSDKMPSIINAPFALLAGPNLALEVAQNIQTTTMVGSANYSMAKEIADFISTDTFKALPTQSIVELQVASALKNVAAIIAGILDGLMYGENTKAWVFSLALEDIANLSKTMQPNTQEAITNAIINPGVAGDLALCFYSKNSRNNAFGKIFAQTPAKQRQSLLDSYPILVEGVRNCKILNSLAIRYKTDTKIVSTLSKILENPEVLESQISALF